MKSNRFLSAVALTVVNAAAFASSSTSSSSEVAYMYLDGNYSGASVTMGVVSANWYQTNLTTAGYWSYDWEAGYDGYSTSNSTGGLTAYSSLPYSYIFNEQGAYQVYAVTNTDPNNWALAAVYLSDYATSSAQGNWNGYGDSFAESEIYNESTGDFYQVATYSWSGLDNNSFSNAYFYWGNQDTGSYNSAFYNSTGPVDAGTGYWASWYGDYTTWLAPGQTEYIYNGGSTWQEAYQTTPSPAALTPFGIGLLGLLRRRRSR